MTVSRSKLRARAGRRCEHPDADHNHLDSATLWCRGCGATFDLTAKGAEWQYPRGHHPLGDTPGEEIREQEIDLFLGRITRAALQSVARAIGNARYDTGKGPGQGER